MDSSPVALSHDVTGDETAMSEALAIQVQAAISAYSNSSQRSRQSDAHILGVSDIGHCREYVRRMIAEEPFTDEQATYDMASFVGTAVGEFAERAFLSTVETPLDWDKQMLVRVELSHGITVSGHPDLVGPNIVVDFKTVNGLSVIRKAGKSTQQKFQLTLYYAALNQQGRLPDDGWCALVWLDRSGVELAPHVEMWRYDPDDLREAIDWVEDVIYALSNGEEASRDKPREFCWACCPFATACRGSDTDVQGLIEDPLVLTAVDLYQQAQAKIKAAEKEKKDAAAQLAGVQGSTGTHTVRWVHINEVELKPQTRAAYDRIDIRPVRLRGAR